MKILITNKHLNNFGGSELVTVELAEYFMSIGHTVLVHCPVFGNGPLDLSHLSVTSSQPTLKHFDLIWFHHWQLVDSFEKSPHQTVVFNHMSSYVEDEFPKDKVKELALADFIFSNSEETRQKIGLGGELMQNPAPPPTMFYPKNGRALFVSNHRPRDLNRFKLDIPIDYVGHESPIRLSTEEVMKYEFIVCNGKSVQYGLRSRIPIFLYDQFGGPGWLTESNFENAEFHNFSGRGFPEPVDLKDIELWRDAKPVFDQVPDKFCLESFIENYGILTPIGRRS